MHSVNWWFYLHFRFHFRGAYRLAGCASDGIGWFDRQIARSHTLGSLADTDARRKLESLFQHLSQKVATLYAFNVRSMDSGPVRRRRPGPFRELMVWYCMYMEAYLTRPRLGYISIQLVIKREAQYHWDARSLQIINMLNEKVQNKYVG